MNSLLETYNNYKNIIGYKIEYTFEDDSKISFIFNKNSFPHLIGLHKLEDIPIIAKFNNIKNKDIDAKKIISLIVDEKITYNSLAKSSRFWELAGRFNNFNKENLLKLVYTEAVIDFDPKLVGNNGSKLKANYIFYEQLEDGSYNHLCVAKDKRTNRMYLESFFCNADDLYIKNQQTIKVKHVRILDNHKKLYLEDTFIQDPPLLSKTTPT